MTVGGIVRIAAAALLVGGGLVLGGGPAVDAADARDDGPAERWRSELYPADWSPSDTTEDGRFLHDFSYAGYAMGERPIPDLADATVFPADGADPTGEADSTAAIQAALDAAGEAGGGVVELPAGTYKLSIPDGARACLTIRHSNVVLRGSAAGDTRLYCDDRVMRGRTVIAIGSGSWTTVGDPIALAADLPNRSTVVPVTTTEGLSVGDWIVLRCDVTEAFIAEHGMEGWWTTRLAGPMFYRRITAIDADASTVSIDIPTRYPLLRRDAARLFHTRPHIAEVGLENLRVGSRCYPGEGFGNNDYNRENRAAYDIHGAHVITVRHVVDGWISDVRSYAPPGSHDRHHMPSNGLLLIQCRNVTVRNCEMSHPQYEGGGGNGYGFTLRSNDCLVTGCDVVSSRHAYDFKSMYATATSSTPAPAATRASPPTSTCISAWRTYSIA